MRRQLHDIALSDRPREKLKRKGARALSDFELLEILIGSGNQVSDVSAIARRVQRRLAQGVQSLSLTQLEAISGISQANACRLLASFELAHRYLVNDLQPLLTTSDILARMIDIRGKSQEYLVCLSLDGGQRLIAQRTITIGTLDTLLAHPREVFAEAIADRAAAIVIGHNHPSNQVEPTPRDMKLTQQLVAAGQIVGIPLLDHIIVTRAHDYSFKQHHLL